MYKGGRKARLYCLLEIVAETILKSRSDHILLL